jgi:hypothetical protein
MRLLKLWTFLVHLTLLTLVSDRVIAAPALTTIQDTLYKADGTRFNGVAYIEWNSFQASDASAVAASSVVVPIADGVLRVRLIATSNASTGAHYFVRYHADGKVQFTETWNVIPSATPVALAAVRVAAGTTTGGNTTPPPTLTVPDITGLAEELANRPVKGFAYATDRILKSGPTGALESVQGNLTDCIRVDGTSGPCGTGGSGSSGPGFVDQEAPTGSINGSNAVFTLTQAPNPASSLELYRNGVLMKLNVDFTLSGVTVTFGSLSIPQTGDLLLASYRLAAVGGLTGPIQAGEIAAGVVSDYNVAAAAGIAESKLALNYPTHSNAFDPSANEKAALSGSAGAPSATNKYVTSQDARLTNARPAVSHSLLSTEHADTIAGTVQRGDLIIGSNATGTPKWARLPLGSANRCLVSNGVDAVWNTCLFTGFRTGAIPFTSADGALAEAPMHFIWDASNRRLSVGSNLNTSTLSVHDGGATGSTTLTVRAGHGQGSAVLQTWQNAAGLEQASIGNDGVIAAKSVEAVSSINRAAWRESGTNTDPTTRSDGDSWYNSTEKSRKTAAGGRINTTPQVLCAASGTVTTATTIASLGTCSIPAGIVNPGDRLAIRATWIHDGPAAYVVRWRWGASTVGEATIPGTATVLDQKGEAAAYASGAVIDIDAKGTAGFAGTPVIVDSNLPFGSGITVGFEGNVTAGTDNLRLVQFTVIRYPAQANP